ncbi:MAG: hypothetical protein NVSMB29_08860 [Candidatus Dormibacteria bacterium]
MGRPRVIQNAVALVVFAAIAVVGIEFLALHIGQPNPFSTNYRVRAIFRDADGIPTSADVRVAGVSVGKVVRVDHDPRQPGYTVVTMEITDSGAVPVYSNGLVSVKPKTLLGEKYVDLKTGHSGRGQELAPEAFLPVSRSSKDVSNDEIFNAFDAKTREEQRQVLAALDQATINRPGDIQAILPQLQQVVHNLAPVAKVYEKDAPQTDQIFTNLNTIMQTLADEHVQLAGLLRNGNIAFGAIADRDQSLLRTLQEAANVSAEFNQAMAPTVAAQRQALAELAPALRSQNAFLSQVVDPQAACGGKSCGIDEVFTGTLTGQIAYPSDQLTVTNAPGQKVATIWDSMFSLPADNHKALNITLSPHCDAATETITNNFGTLESVIGAIPQSVKDQINKVCPAAGGSPPNASYGPGAPPAAATASTLVSGGAS